MVAARLLVRSLGVALSLIPIGGVGFGATGCQRPAQVATAMQPGGLGEGESEGEESRLSCGAQHPEGVALQILGSGGPIADDRRASSGYLVWVDGRARALVDVGGGVILNFAASGAALEDLEVVVLSHLHVDHSVDFAALIKTGYFSERKRSLPVVGPDGNDYFPGLNDYLGALFGAEGAYRYLGWALREQEGAFVLEPHEVVTAGEGERFEFGEISLAALGVPHGAVPALGLRLEAGGRSIAFGGDQRLDDARYIEAIRGVDLLVAHHAIPERSGGPVRTLHGPPSAIGKAAAKAKVGRLVLSHHMIRALRGLDEGIAAVREAYRGPLLLAEDLACIPLG